MAGIWDMWGPSWPRGMPYWYPDCCPQLYSRVFAELFQATLSASPYKYGRASQRARPSPPNSQSTMSTTTLSNENNEKSVLEPSTTDGEDEKPEVEVDGGLRAWLVVAGRWWKRGTPERQD